MTITTLSFNILILLDTYLDSAL